MTEMTPAELRLAIAKAKGWEETGDEGARFVIPPKGDSRRNWADAINQIFGGDA